MAYILPYSRLAGKLPSVVRLALHDEFALTEREAAQRRVRQEP